MTINYPKLTKPHCLKQLTDCTCAFLSFPTPLILLLVTINYPKLTKPHCLKQLTDCTCAFLSFPTPLILHFVTINCLELTKPHCLEHLMDWCASLSFPTAVHRIRDAPCESCYCFAIMLFTSCNQEILKFLTFWTSFDQDEVLKTPYFEGCTFCAMKLHKQI